MKYYSPDSVKVGDTVSYFVSGKVTGLGVDSTDRVIYLRTDAQQRHSIRMKDFQDTGQIEKREEKKKLEVGQKLNVETIDDYSPLPPRSIVMRSDGVTGTVTDDRLVKVTNTPDGSLAWTREFGNVKNLVRCYYGKPWTVVYIPEDER